MRVRTLWKIGSRSAPMLIYVDRYETAVIVRVGDIRQSDTVLARNAEKLKRAVHWMSGKS